MRKVIAPRWGSEEGWDRSQPSPLGWAKGARAFGPEGSRFLRSWVAPEPAPFPARGQLEARRGRPSLAQGIALGGEAKVHPEAA
jgi:hypothetical protein